MKEHIKRDMINSLRDTALTFHGTQQLRERIATVVNKYLEKDKEFKKSKGVSR